MDEYQSIQDASVWEVYNESDLPEGRKAIGSRWVFKVKLNADGSIDRYKAHLIVKGYSQKSGIDYDETFAPVSRYDSLRLIIAFASINKLELGQLDIKTAFLNGILQEEIWMSPPPGIGLDGKVLLLKKALYGLKQAPHAWYDRLSSALAEIMFVASNFDPCVFICTERKTILVVYVDDLTIVGTTGDLKRLKEHLQSHFIVTDKGKLHWLLGIEIIETERAIELSQHQYVEHILQRFGMENSNSVTTPLDKKLQLQRADPDEEIIDINLYQQMIGCLNYLVTGTRPDLAYTVSFLSQFMSHPLEIHHQAVKRVFRYLSRTRNMKLIYPRHYNCQLELFGYSDADYANCIDTRKSYSGYAFQLGNCTISWSSKKQNSVSTSTTEAEYVALSLTSRQAIWYMKAFVDLGITLPITIHTDSESAMKVADNPVLYPKTKHIAVHYHFTRDCLLRESFTLEYIPGEHNPADLMTKNLERIKHTEFTQQLGCII